jgi:NAD(P)-dependent dehydrogenase (short-subunit alcohol dehydrogenase family)/mannose/cellobiose epimerase-like protein (N-acyl-D-glucosamine 2-epimerase family)
MPGRESELEPSAEHIRASYKGSGRLAGRCALITGGDSGIGRAVALHFAREGASVAITFLPEEADDGAEAIRAIEAEGARAVAVIGDLREPTFCDNAIEQVVAAFGRLDILVNNAGIQKAADELGEISDADWEWHFGVNVDAMFRMSRAALPHLGEGASIIATTSVNGFVGNKRLVAYSATKGAMMGFTRALSQQLAPRGIRVNEVAPGPIWTAIQPAGFGPVDPQMVADMGKDVPMGRIGQPSEVGPAYVFSPARKRRTSLDRRFTSTAGCRSMVDMLATLSVPSDSWLRSPLHHQWLETQGQKLLDFSKESRVDAGFAPLDDRGFLSDDAHADTIVTARMTHAYALGAVQGLPGCAPLVEHGIAALLGPLRDERHGGWLPMEGGGRKLAYVHAFVGLAASSAIVAEAKGADTLMAHVLPVLEDRFWSDEEGAMRESFAADWSDEEDYRGANSNMHSTEMAMALADVLDAPVWRERALRIVTRIVHDLASQRNYRLLEHFDRNWAPILDYNADDICNDLRPYGQTPGHFLEWSHLLLKLEAALLRAGEVAPDWLLTDAIGLFDAGVTTGWARNGKPGILYTVDSKDEPSVSNRPHWVQ